MTRTLKHAEKHMGYRDGTLTWLEVVDMPNYISRSSPERFETVYKGNGYLVSRCYDDTTYHVSSRCETLSSGYKTAELARTGLRWLLDLHNARERIIQVDIFYNYIPKWRKHIDVEDRFDIEDDLHGTINVTDTASGRAACVGYGDYDCGGAEDRIPCNYTDPGLDECLYCHDHGWVDYCPSCTARYLESVCEALAVG